MNLHKLFPQANAINAEVVRLKIVQAQETMEAMAEILNRIRADRARLDGLLSSPVRIGEEGMATMLKLRRELDVAEAETIEKSKNIERDCDALTDFLVEMHLRMSTQSKA